MKKRIAIDMDEVLVDTANILLSLYNKTFSTNLTKEELSGRSIYDSIPPDRVAGTRGFMCDPCFFESPGAIPGSKDTVPRLMEKYEVFVATAAMEFPTSFAAKFNWLKMHFPMIPDSNIVFCGDKSILQADYLIDDSPRHFTRFKGEGILFSAHHNLGETQYRRVNGWAEVESLFLPPRWSLKDYRIYGRNNLPQLAILTNP